MKNTGDFRSQKYVFVCVILQNIEKINRNERNKQEKCFFSTCQIIFVLTLTV